MKRHFIIKSITLCAVWLLVSSLVFAGNTVLTSYLNKADIKPTTNIDIKSYTMVNTQTANFINIVRLIYNRSAQSDDFTNGEWTYQVNYRLSDVKSPGTFYDGSVKISFEEGSAVYEDISRFNLAFAQANLKITSVLAYHDAGSGMSLVTDPHLSPLIPEDIHLELQSLKEEYSPISAIVPRIDFDPVTHTVAWYYIPGAEEYELEYTFIDALISPAPSFSVYEDPFEYQEPVRIRTVNNHQEIDMVYPQGTLYFRVRGVGKGASFTGGDYAYYSYGRWGYNSAGNLSAPGESYTITAPNAFQNMKTWQYQATYAENGKHKSVISYYDGTSRNRQQQTNLSTEGITLVGETKYDSEGRGVMQIMPAPKATNDLHYEAKFNIAAGQTSLLPEHYEQGAGVALDDSKGAAAYYSDNNPFVNNPFRDFIPTSQDGYPYTQMTYLKDNTGKVQRQSGLGSTFKLGDGIGDGRETEYYYGTPTGTELHRLFGDNVGIASHYKKVMTVDANEQLSMTYMDQEGRTIATSLVGQGPTNLSTLPENVTENITVSFNGNNVNDVDKGVSESFSKLMNVLPNTIYSFTYEFDGTMFQSDANGSVCLDCAYDLTITINGPEGEAIDMTVTLPSPETTNVITQHFEKPMATSCTSENYTPVNGTITFTATFPRIGDYTVNKKLVLNKSDLSTKIEAALNAAGLGAAYLSTLTTTHFGYIDYSDCYGTCAERCSLYVADNFPSLMGSAFTDAVNDCIEDCAETLLNTDPPVTDGVMTEIMEEECDAILNYITSLSPAYESNPSSHPGYCHYQACLDLVDSKVYDIKMGKVEDWTEAVAKDFDDPLNTPNKDPFLDLLDTWNALLSPVPTTPNTLREIFEDRLDNYYTDGMTTYTLDEFVDPSINTDLYTTVPVANRWKIYRGIYYQIKQEMIDLYKELDECEYDGMLIPMPAIAPPTVAIYQARQTLLLDSLNGIECSTICEVNVEVWMNKLRYLPCWSSLSPSDTTDLRAQLSYYCLNSCGDKNPLGVLFKKDHLAGDLNLAQIHSILDNAGCSSDSLFVEDPYKYTCTTYRVLSPTQSQCLEYLVDFYNTYVGPVFQSNGNTSTCGEEHYSVFAIPGEHPLRSCVPPGLPYSLVVPNTHFAITFGDSCGINSDCHLLRNTYSGLGNYDSLTLVPPGTLTATNHGQTIYIDVQGWTGGAVSADLSLQVGSVFFPGAISYSCWDVMDTTCVITGIVDSIVTTFEYPCEDLLEEIATYNANQQWIYERNIFAGTLIDEYEVKCMTNKEENFYASYQDNEYHYTLYYYDQAGNLVQTVPPEGVDKLASSGGSFVNGEYQGPGPDHRLRTLYQYNSMNQVVSQTTPDGGETNFWYTDKQQLRFSQSARQELIDDFSYTKYDEQGRIIEVGESSLDECTFNLDGLISNMYFPDRGWDVTYTRYDGYDSGIPSMYSTNPADAYCFNYEFMSQGDIIMRPMPRYLRNRVSGIYYFEGTPGTIDCSSPISIPYHTATFYAYDAHGNVKRMAQEDNIYQLFEQPLARIIDYRYDLVSGNVRQVTYQPNKPDEFMHRYYYDADNRIITALTSEQGYSWEHDASYFYYPHGPLARMELGEDLVQGTDYAYTLQGWLKAINATTLDPRRDMGKDGNHLLGNNHHRLVAQDVMGLELDYFNGDYDAIGTFATNENFRAAGTHMANSGRQLFNGNIHGVSVALTGIDEEQIDIYGYEHYYDQLNRLVQRTSDHNSNKLRQVNDWTGVSSNNDYAVLNVVYDANGNIREFERRGDGGNTMDDMTYNYDLSSGELTNNRLRYIDDVSSSYNDDIDDQNANNYVYDASGNLIQDVAEGIANIEWNAYGKIRKITGSGSHDDLEFKYDPSGNRYAKIVKHKTGSSLQSQDQWDYTYYVRDAQGNVIANYSRTYTSLGSSRYTVKVAQTEVPLYGSSRLGVKKYPEGYAKEVTTTYFKASVDGTSGLFTEYMAGGPIEVDHAPNDNGVLVSPGGDVTLKDDPDINGAENTVLRLYGPEKIDVQTTGESISILEGEAYVTVLGSNHVEIEANRAVKLESDFHGMYFTSAGPINFETTTAAIQYCNCAEVTVPSLLPSWANVMNYPRNMGFKYYELSNHLGNVHEVVSDRKIGRQGILSALVQEDFGNAASFSTWTGTEFDGSSPCSVCDDWKAHNVPPSLLSYDGTNKRLRADVNPGGSIIYGVSLGFETVLGHVYHVSFDYDGDGSQTTDYGPSIKNNIGGPGGYTQIVGFLTTDTHVEFDFVAQNTTYHRLDILGSDNTYTKHFYIDNVTITEVGSAYIADVKSYADYYPFGSLEPQRHETEAGSDYRYGFNGMEKDDEVKSVTGSSYDFGARMYDPRVGRWMKVDPQQTKYPGHSPYHYAYCNPIVVVDPDGEENIIVVGNQGSSPKSDKNSDGSYRYGENRRHFLEAGLNEALRLKSERTQKGEATTLIIFQGKDPDIKPYTSKEIEDIKDRAAAKGIGVIVVNDVDEIEDYVNYKSTDPAFFDFGGEREKDLITDFSFIGHGAPDDLLVGHNDYDDIGRLDGIINDYRNSMDLSNFDEESFSLDCRIDLNACASGLGEVFENAQSLTDGTVKGYNTTVIWGGNGLGTSQPFDKKYVPYTDQAARNDPNRPILNQKERTRTETGTRSD